MHLSEGILPAPLLLAGGLVTVAGVAIGLRRLQDEALPRTALLTAAFFVASLIHVPIGIGSTHLMLIGLMGTLLGWAAFPAILIALFLQSVIFGFGGVTVLGVNTAIMAIPAILAGALFRGLARRVPPTIRGAAVLGAGVGALAIALSALLTAGALVAAGKSFYSLAVVLVTAQLPAMGVEALLTGGIVAYLARVRPALLPRPREGLWCS